MTEDTDTFVARALASITDFREVNPFSVPFLAKSVGAAGDVFAVKVSDVLSAAIIRIV